MVKALAPVLLVVRTNWLSACSINAPLIDPAAPELMRNFPDGDVNEERTITIPVHCKLEFISKSFGTCRIPNPVRLAFSFRLLSVITSTAGWSGVPYAWAGFRLVDASS